MPRVSTDGSKSVYMKSDETFTETISHQKSNGRVNSLIRYDQKIIAADQLTAEQKFQTATFKVILERPLAGFTDQQLKDFWDAIKTQLGTGAAGAIEKIIGQET